MRKEKCNHIFDDVDITFYTSKYGMKMSKTVKMCGHPSGLTPYVVHLCHDCFKNADTKTVIKGF